MLRIKNLGKFEAKKRSAFLIILFVISGFWITHAQGDDFGTCTGNVGCRADNLEHTYCFGATLNGDGFQTASGYAMTNLVAQTNFIKTYMASCSGNTDVVFKRDDSIGPSAFTQCLDFVNGTNRCNRARVVFDGDFLNNWGMDNKKSTACHEVGHTGGLAHGATNDCMTNATPSSNIHYNGHHIAHLNQNG